jgi:4-hydroxy-3-polyprenylbenzoate decarboxylase
LPSFPSLRNFLDWCAETDQFQRVPDPVSVIHQMTAVHRNVLETRGSVPQFDPPVLQGGAPSEVPVVVNLFGTTERVAAGLGVTLAGLDDLGRSWRRLDRRHRQMECETPCRAGRC